MDDGGQRLDLLDRPSSFGFQRNGELRPVAHHEVGLDPRLLQRLEGAYPIDWARGAGQPHHNTHVASFCLADQCRTALGAVIPSVSRISRWSCTSRGSSISRSRGRPTRTLLRMVAGRPLRISTLSARKTAARALWVTNMTGV